MEPESTPEQPLVAGVVRHTALSDWFAIQSYLVAAPTPDSVAQLQAQSLGDDLRAIGDELGLGDGELHEVAAAFDALQQRLAADEDALGSIRREHTRVFSHPIQPIIWPYEGVFCDQEKEAQGLATSESRLFVNRASMDAERTYKANGFRMASTKLPADNIGVELGFASRMHAAAAEALMEGDDNRAAQCEEVVARFMAEHIDAWVPRFFERCLEECRHDYYALTARLGLLLLSAARR